MIRSMETKIGDISLTEINKVKDFCNLMASLTSDVSLVSGKYVVDAKSIMGIFSLDLSKPISFYLDSKDDAEIASIRELVKDFIIE